MHNNFEHPWYEHILILASIGSVIGLAQALSHAPRLSWAMLISKAVTSGAIGAMAVLVGFFKPDVNFELQVGVACALGTIGSDVIIKLIVNRYSTSE
jgi:hypothetical protein